MKRCILLAMVVLLASFLIPAQTFRGGIQGIVTDSQGAAVAGAQVTVSSAETGLKRTAQTGGEGNYVFNELPLGTYTVEVTQPGFRTASVKEVKVEVSGRAHVDVTLQPGEVKETVTVTAAPPLIETTGNNMGGTIEGTQAAEIPLNGRDFTKLLTMVPGAAGDSNNVADSPGSFGLIAVNGSRGRSNNYLLDGTDMNDGYRNLPAINQGGVFGTPSTILPIDALAEIPVISNGEAEYGRNSGAIVNMVTKSGTNSLHGSVYEYFRNDALDARNYFNRATDPSSGSPLPQNAFKNNQFGGSLGGPIVKDKTFFFVAYEGQRERVGLPFSNTLPTQEMITNFLATGATINPIISNLLALDPWGQTLPATGLSGVEVQQTVRASNRVDSFIGKIDHHIGKHLLTGRYFFGDSDQTFPLALLSGGTVPGYSTTTPTRVQILSLSYTHVVSDKTLLELRGGWNRFHETFHPEDATFDPASIGLNNGVSADQFGLPLISISGFAPIGANRSLPRGRTDTNWQLFANMSHNTGKHNLKWGYEFRRTFVNGFFDAGYRGRLGYGADAADDLLTPWDETNAFHNFLAGFGGSGNQLRGESQRYTFQNSHAFYFQDNWRLSQHFTVNLGLRWDYFGVIGEKNGLLSLFDPDLQRAPFGSCAAAVCPVARLVDQLYPKDYNNFAPRVSFAWDVRGNAKTVLRAGWGIYYDVFSQDFFVGQLPWPTFNSGPAYNFFSETDPNSIYLSYDENPFLGVVAGPCGAGQVTIPNSGGMCANPMFLFDPTFGNDTFTVDQRIRTPYVQNWNVNVQQALGNKVSLQVGYVGSKGTKLFQYIDANQFNPAVGDYPYGGVTGFFYVLQFGSTASSNYHGLQASLNFRGWHGLTSMLSYTWSHSIDTASDGQDYVPNATQPDNSYDPARERANSNYDQRHRFIWNFVYELPKFSESAKWLTQGWGIDGVLQANSGMPYNVNWIDDFGYDFNGTAEFYGRPDLVGNPFAGTGGLNILNLSALKVPCNYDAVADGCAGGEHIGTLPRNAFVGPSFRNFDFSLVKNTMLGERVKMQIRADFFNIFNHPNFGNPLWPGFAVDMMQNDLNPGTGPLDPMAGTGQGFLQPTTTPDVGAGNPYLGGGGPRNIQLAIKFTF